MKKEDKEVKRVVDLINQIHEVTDKQLLNSSSTVYDEFKKELLRVINLDSNIIEYELNEGEFVFLSVLEALNEKYSYCMKEEFQRVILKLISELRDVVYPKHEFKDYSISKYKVLERLTYDSRDKK